MYTQKEELQFGENKLQNVQQNSEIESANFDDKDDEKQRKEEAIEEEQNEESGDWGDVDPAAGDEPSSPGSAV